MALVAFSLLHRDPDIWTHPDEFYPDHFLPEEAAARPKGSYFPFSWGPRSCPGKCIVITNNGRYLTQNGRVLKVYITFKILTES